MTPPREPTSAAQCPVHPTRTQPCDICMTFYAAPKPAPAAPAPLGDSYCPSCKLMHADSRGNCRCQAAPAPDAVRRFDCFTREDGVYESATGAHVAYADFAAQAREIADYRKELSRMKHENDVFLHSSVAEIAARNIDVRSYMEHWEGRTKRAEADNAVLVAILRALCTWDATIFPTDVAKAGHLANIVNAARAKVQP